MSKFLRISHTKNHLIFDKVIKKIKRFFGTQHIQGRPKRGQIDFDCLYPKMLKSLCTDFGMLQHHLCYNTFNNIIINTMASNGEWHILSFSSLKLTKSGLLIKTPGKCKKSILF